MTAIFSFIFANRWTLLLALAAAIFAGGWIWLGSHDRALVARTQAADMAAADKVALERMKAALQEQHDREAIGYQIGLDAAKAQQAVITVTQTITKEVPVHVSDQADRAGLLTRGFVRLHDAAALGVPAERLPNPAGSTDDDTSPIGPRALAGAIVGNYGQCQGYIVQIEAWQAWATAQMALSPK